MRSYWAVNAPSTLIDSPVTDDAASEARKYGCGDFVRRAETTERVRSGNPIAHFRSLFAETAVHHVRGDAARCDGVHADALIRIFQGGLSGNAGGVDDRASPVFDRGRELVFHGRKDSPDIDIENTLKLRLFDLNDWSQGLDTGIVESDIEPAVFLYGLRDEVLHVRFPGDVPLDKGGFAAGGFDLLDHGVAFGFTPFGNDDLGASRGEFQGRGFSDAAGGTGDEDYSMFHGNEMCWLFCLYSSFAKSRPVVYQGEKRVSGSVSQTIANDLNRTAEGFHIAGDGRALLRSGP